MQSESTVSHSHLRPGPMLKRSPVEACTSNKKRVSSPIGSLDLLDVFGIGEQHRAEFSNQSRVILSAAARETENIRLTSAVTVLVPRTPPVRVVRSSRPLDSFSRAACEIVAVAVLIGPYPLFGPESREDTTHFLQKNRSSPENRGQVRKCTGRQTPAASYRPSNLPFARCRIRCLYGRCRRAPRIFRSSWQAWPFPLVAMIDGEP